MFLLRDVSARHHSSFGVTSLATGHNHPGRHQRAHTNCVDRSDRCKLPTRLDRVSSANFAHLRDLSVPMHESQSRCG